MSSPIFLVSSEKTTHEIPRFLIGRSGFLSECSEGTVEINAKAGIIEKILEFYKHYEASDPEKMHKPLPSHSLQGLIPAWDYAFIELDTEVLLELTQASETLKLQGLLELCCAKIASLIRDKTPEELEDLFSIKKADI